MESNQLIQLLAPITTIAVFMFAHFKSRKRDREVANREIYQRLEFASIELFRFEADHPELVRALWQEGGAVPEEDSAEDMILQDFVCQYLNLFEMALQLRRQDVVPHDVFGSWVVWYFNLAGAPGFPRIWQKLRCDYLADLAQVMDRGIEIHKSVHGEAAQRRAFFDFFAEKLENCSAIRKWHANQTDSASKPKGQILELQAVETHWDCSASLVDEIVPFMVANMDEHYISHSEIMEGRAIDASHWHPNLAEVLRGEFAECYPPGLESPQDTCFFCCIRSQGDNAIVALGLCEIYREGVPPYASLHDMIISEKCRGQGVGTILLNAIEDVLRAQNISRIYIESGLGNDGAHAFFHKANFHPLSTVSSKDLS